MKRNVYIDAVLELVLDHFFALRHKKWVGVHDADWMPIPWFGDLEAYSCSPRRIVTVGINPSQKEFAKPRFDAAVLRSIYSARSVADIDLEAYRATLNSYFANPYKRWFNHFQKVLAALQASFDKSQPSRALHIDLMTPLPTTPSWGWLDATKRKLISQNEVFNMLVAALKPQLVIFVPKPLHLETAGLAVGPV